MRSRTLIQQIFDSSFDEYTRKHSVSPEQRAAVNSILACKSGKLGYNVSICSECGHTQFHNNSCRNRSCPNCQAILKEIWIDKRRSEVIDSSYFHVVFTVPHDLNPLFLANQKLLYTLFHQCCSQVLLELASDHKYLGAVPGIIQILHTWGQKLDYHPHIHCIVSGGGLSRDLKLKKCGRSFFIPVKVISRKFRGKFLYHLKQLYSKGSLHLPDSCSDLEDPRCWYSFVNVLFQKDWCPFIKETFNGMGNAIEYLGRYANRIAITNTRIRSVSDSHTVFSARDYRTGDTSDVTLSNEEFIRRFLMHVLPKGFQKIRYYGFLCNRSKKRLLDMIFSLQGHQRFPQRFSGLSVSDVLRETWGYDIRICRCCGCLGMQPAGRTFSSS